MRHERERRAWHAWIRRAAKTFFVGQDEIEQMVAHLCLAQREEPKASSWKDSDGGKVLEHCVPILNHGFRLLVDTRRFCAVS